MKRTSGSSLGYYTIGIATLFLAGFLLLVVLGAQSYRNTVAEQNGNMSSRALLSYLATCIKANDSENCLSIEDSDFGPVLVVADGTTGYAIHIYQHNGFLLEEYAKADAEPDPDSAQAIGATELFEIEELDAGLLSVSTDEGRVLLHIRSEGGG